MKRTNGFSLIEVMVAIGVVAVGVTAILGLMGTLTKQVGEHSERLRAESATATAIAEFERIGFAAAVAKISLAGAAPESAVFFVTRDGANMGWGEATVAANRYFAVSVSRLDSSPQASDNTGQGVQVHVLTEWPANATERNRMETVYVLLR